MKSFNQYLESNDAYIGELIETIHHSNINPQDFMQEFFEKAIAEESDLERRKEIEELYVEFTREAGQMLRQGWNSVKNAGQNFAQGWNSQNYAGYPNQYQPILNQFAALHKTLSSNPQLLKLLTPKLRELGELIKQSASQGTETPADAQIVSPRSSPGMLPTPPKTPPSPGGLVYNPPSAPNPQSLPRGFGA